MSPRLEDRTPILEIPADIQTDIAESVCLIAETVVAVSENPQKWKWSVLAEYSALLGLMTQALKPGDWRLDEGYEKRPIDSKRPVTKPGRLYPGSPHSDGFMKIYGKLMSQDENFPFAESERHQDALFWLSEHRNGFVHFDRNMWPIDIPEMADACLTCMDVLEYLAFDSEHVVWENDEQRARVQTQATNIRRHLTALCQRLPAAEQSA